MKPHDSSEARSYALGQVAEITLGCTPTRREESSGEVVRIIQVGDLFEETHSIRPKELLNEATVQTGLSMDRYTVKTGDVLMSCKGTIGRLAVVDEAVEGAVATSNLLIIRPMAGMEPMALLAILKSSKTQQFLQSRARGSMIQTISFRDLEGLAVPILSSLAQRHLASLLEAHIELVQALREAESSRRDLLQGLIDHTLWGERS